MRKQSHRLNLEYSGGQITRNEDHKYIFKAVIYENVSVVDGKILLTKL